MLTNLLPNVGVIDNNSSVRMEERSETLLMLARFVVGDVGDRP